MMPRWCGYVVLSLSHAGCSLAELTNVVYVTHDQAAKRAQSSMEHSAFSSAASQS
jgi:hypothetical protein